MNAQVILWIFIVLNVLTMILNWRATRRHYKCITVLDAHILRSKELIHRTEYELQRWVDLDTEP